MRWRGLCELGCWHADLVWGEEQSPFSVSLVSMMMMKKKAHLQTAGSAAPEVGGSPQPPLEGGGTLTDWVEEGKAQNLEEEGGSSQERSPHVGGARVEAGAEGLRSRRAGAVGPSEAPAVPEAGWIS